MTFRRYGIIQPTQMFELEQYRLSMPQEISDRLLIRSKMELLDDNQVKVWIGSTLWEKFFRDRKIKIRTVKN